jgi:hypothetical protein
MVKQLSVLIGALLVSSSALAAGVPVSHAIAAVGGTSASGVNFKVKQPLSPAWGMLTTLTGSGTATYNRNDTINLGSSGGGSTTNTITFTGLPLGDTYVYASCTDSLSALTTPCKLPVSGGVYTTVCRSMTPTPITVNSCSSTGYVYVFLGKATFSSSGASFLAAAQSRCLSSPNSTGEAGILKVPTGANRTVSVSPCSVQ